MKKPGDFDRLILPLFVDTSFHGIIPKGNVPQADQRTMVNRAVTKQLERQMWIVVKVWGDNYYDIQLGSTFVLDFNFETGKLENTGNFSNTNVERHSRVFNSTGVKLEVGDQCRIAYRDHDITQKPYIKSSNRMPTGQRTTVDIVVPSGDIITWLQSNRTSYEVPYGGKAPLYSYNFQDQESLSNEWPVPTRYNTGSDRFNTERDYYPYGMGRWQPVAGDDLYIAAYPQKQADGKWAVAISAWAVASKAMAWEAVFTATAQEGEPTLPPRRSTMFFADPISQVASVIHDQASSAPEIYSAKSGSIKQQTTLDKFSHNASIHGFLGPDPENETVLTNQTYLCLPYTDEDHTTIDFWKLNYDTFSWSKTASFAASGLPSGGSSSIPDRPYFIGSGQTDPIAWTPTNEALIPCVGGVQVVSSSTDYTLVQWALRGLKPTGVLGARLGFQNIEATDSPRVLSSAGFTTPLNNLLALRYQFTGNSSLDNPLVYKVYGEVSFSHTEGDSFYNKLPDCLPVFMPCAGPNMQHLPKQNGLEARMAYSTERNWPLDTRVRPGGCRVDKHGTAWVVLSIPEPVLYYSQHTSNVPDGMIGEAYDTGTTKRVYYYTDRQDRTECLGGVVQTFGWNVESIFHPGYGGDVSTDPDEWPTTTSPCGNTAGTAYSSFTMEDKGLRPWWSYRINLGLGVLWHQKLIGVKSDNTMTILDVSQKHDVEITKTISPSDFGGSGSAQTFTVTEADVPTPDAVWDWFVFDVGDDSFVAILRDLHYDNNGDCHPAPVLEVRLLSPNTVVSTTRLGSQEFRDEGGGNEETGFSYTQGDLVWNPYYKGAPRMKSGLDPESNTVVVLGVYEARVVDSLAGDNQEHRLHLYSVNLTNPASPIVKYRSETFPSGAPDEEPLSPTVGPWPRWEEWDTLNITDNFMAWVRDSVFKDCTNEEA